MRSRAIRGTWYRTEQHARHLRAEMTPAETILWEALRRRQLCGLRFRRQHPVEDFVLDFYCPDHKLVVEVDGASHTDRVEQDAIRDATLRAHGCQVMRFTNSQVLTDLWYVLICICEAVAARRLLSDAPLPSSDALYHTGSGGCSLADAPYPRFRWTHRRHRNYRSDH